jgi:16S rRNA (adenine1518-N6/adenine1519-N6)-dimethyltransferase
MLILALCYCGLESPSFCLLYDEITHMPPKSKLGQNFLIDPLAAERIVDALGDLSGRTIVEIGPGRGAITDMLVRRAKHVIAVEFDASLAAVLRDRFTPGQLTLVEQDVLDFDFAAASLRAGERLSVAGNLPYYITSPILLKLASSHASLATAALMVQREVADRVVAAPGSRDYGLLSVTVQMYGPVERLFTLPPEAFSPPPEVHSTVFRWRFAPRFAELGVPEDRFLAFVRQAFAQKRKTLANNLRAAGVEAKTAAEAVEQAGIDPRARAEMLSVETFAALYRLLEKQEPA